MVKTRVLRVNRLSVAAPGISLVLDDLLSTQILTEWQSSPAEIPEQYVLTFAHYVLFIGKYLSSLRKLDDVITPKEGFET